MITAEALEARGFVRHEYFGYAKELSPPQGEGASPLTVAVGTHPCNSMCVCLLVGGYGIVTNAACLADIDALIRLLEGAYIDHPDEAWIDFGDEEEDDGSAERG